MSRKESAKRPISFSSVGEKIEEYNQRTKSLDTSNQRLPIGIKTPLNLKKGTLFEMNYRIEDQIHDNLKNLIMTNKGERLGNPDFGCDLKRIQFSVSNYEDIEIAMMSSIQASVKKYMPFIELQEFAVEDLDNNESGTGGLISAKIIGLSLTYTVPQLNSRIHGIRLALPMGI